MSAYGGKASGLCNLDGRDASDPADPIAVRPGDIKNGQRYRESLRIQSVSPTAARVAVSLDGKPYLPNWTGDPAALGVNANWGPECPRGLALCGPDVTFHSVRLRLNSGSASSTVVDAASAEQIGSIARLSAPPRFTIGQWVDVLRLVDTKKNVVAGTWSRKGPEIMVEPNQTPRIMIPVSVEGSYDYEVDFTRTGGSGDVVAMFSVAAHPCMATLSADDGKVSGIQDIDYHEVFSPDNPIVVRPGTLENGRRYRLLVKARVASGDRASFDVLLDGKAYLPHWEGKSSSLSGCKDWPQPNPRGLALGSQQSSVTFHAARLRMLSGSALLDGAPENVNSISGTYTVASKYNGLFLAISGGGTNQGTPAGSRMPTQGPTNFGILSHSRADRSNSRTATAALHWASDRNSKTPAPKRFFGAGAAATANNGRFSHSRTVP